MTDIHALGCHEGRLYVTFPYICSCSLIRVATFLQVCPVWLLERPLRGALYTIDDCSLGPTGSLIAISQLCNVHAGRWAAPTTHGLRRRATASEMLAMLFKKRGSDTKTQGAQGSN